MLDAKNEKEHTTMQLNNVLLCRTIHLGRKLEVDDENVQDIRMLCRSNVVKTPLLNPYMSFSFKTQCTYNSLFFFAISIIIGTTHINYMYTILSIIQNSCIGLEL
jgi:hypothetical protein